MNKIQNWIKKNETKTLINTYEIRLPNFQVIKPNLPYKFLSYNI